MRQSAAKLEYSHNTCIHCGESKEIDRFVKDKGSQKGVRNTCLDCSLARSKKNPNYKKIRNGRVQKYRHTLRGGIYQRMQAAKRRSAVAKLPFNLDIDYLVALYEDQEGLCKLTKNPLLFGNEVCWWDRASLDKIKPADGYVKGNVQLLTNRVNTAKGNLDNEEFLSLCRDVIREGSTTIPKGSTLKRVEAPNSRSADDIV